MLPSLEEEKLSKNLSNFSNINSRLSYIRNPYPIKNLGKLLINSNTCIAIEGFGLTCFDILAFFTIGQGGKFITDSEGTLEYISSGKEPKIIIYSLSGIPLFGRAINQKGSSFQYKSKFFTFDLIDELRKQYGIGLKKQLHFEQVLLYYLKLEMQYCYYATLAKKNKLSYQVIEDLENHFSMFPNEETTKKFINQYFDSDIQFDWLEIMDPTKGRNFTSAKEYSRWLIDYLINDYQKCLEGNIEGPYKAACDVLRDVRDIIRYAIDFAGLTENSHKVFLKKYMPMMNRISVGPPKERIAELLALYKHGIIDITAGPKPSLELDFKKGKFILKNNNIVGSPIREIDIVIKARIDAPMPLTDNSILMKKLIKKGTARPFFNGNFHPSGIDINKSFHLISKEGIAQPTIWAIGTVVEGPKFYTYIVPRAGVNSTGLVDAGRAVLNMVTHIKNKNEILIFDEEIV